MRHLHDREKALIKRMVRGLRLTDAILSRLDDVIVEDMDDGGMGSLKVLGPWEPGPRMGERLCVATFADKDQVPVSITISLDENGRFFELDVWKVDNSPLIQFPDPEQVVVQ